MNQRNSFVVDFVATGARPGEWRMVLVEEGPWDGAVDDNLLRLQDRLYECVDAALGGQLAARFPESAGQFLVIQVDGYNLPGREVTEFFNRFSTGVLKTEDYRASLIDNRFVSAIEFELVLKDTRH